MCLICPMKISVIGCGYVGLVTAHCMRVLGHEVLCIDNDDDKIDQLKRRICPIKEPGINVGDLKFSTEWQDSDFTFICVGTPSNPDGSCDISQVLKAAELVKSGVVVVKSTVPPGTCRKVHQITELYTFSNPEFLREGTAVQDFMNPDRIVIGGFPHHILSSLYVLIDAPVVKTDWESAELIKLASNAFLATKIAYINEIWQICMKTGANIQDVSNGIGLDKRIGHWGLQPGPGYGGMCFPKDTKSLANVFSTPIVEATTASNDAWKREIAHRILDTGAGRIAILGMTFKAGTDDTREAAHRVIAPILLEYGRTLFGYDPSSAPGNVTAQSIANQAELVVILTEWPEFKNIKHPNIMDFRLIVETNTESQALQVQGKSFPNLS